MSSVGEDRTETGRKVTVAEAAQVLDTTADAIRSRIKRGTLQSVKEKNTVYVFLRPDQTPPEHRPDDDQTTARTQSDATALIAEMRDHIEDLREQLEAERQAHSEARRLLLSALEKIPPALEPPASEAPEPREWPTIPGLANGHASVMGARRARLVSSSRTSAAKKV